MKKAFVAAFALAACIPVTACGTSGKSVSQTPVKTEQSQADESRAQQSQGDKDQSQTQQSQGDKGQSQAQRPSAEKATDAAQTASPSAVSEAGSKQDSPEAVSPEAGASVPGASETPKLSAKEGVNAALPLSVKITDENYQSLFQLAPEYKYIGKAYFKAPRDMFGQDAFVDAYIPYGENIEYPEDGFAVRVEAHGMRVYETIVFTQGNAKTVVDQKFQELSDGGADIYSEGSADTYYDEGYDIAVKQYFYFEDNKTKSRPSILYADTRQNGYYLFAEITYLPEQFDDGHDALVAELRDVFALNLPDFPAME